MTAHRFGQVVGLCAALAAFGCNSGNAKPETRGSLQARLMAQPSAVKAVRITVTGAGISGDVHADMTDLGGGNWVGSVANVPAGVANRTVMAYAYSSLSIPADPTSDFSNLIYRGVKAGVSVTDGQVSAVTIVLTPYPGNDGGLGINTPPHITTTSHPVSVLNTGSAALSATALDPDLNATLTYTWSDGGAGGTFSGGAGNPATNKLSGNAVTVGYTPAIGSSGNVTIGLSVTDGVATTSTSFSLGVIADGGTVDPTLVFDTGPAITISSIGSQSLTASGSTNINYDVQGGVGPLFATWTDSCNGSFGSYGAAFFPPFIGATVQYTAPAVAPVAPECDLTLTVLDSAGATTWSRVIVWVDAPADLGGKAVFVTSTQVDGAFFNGSPASADLFCQQSAGAGSGPNKPPAGTYKAFLSFTGPGNSAGERIADAAFVLADGTAVAASKADLLDGSILHNIDMDENGNTISAEVWTGSLADGTFDGAHSQCLDWTSNVALDVGTAGWSWKQDPDWVRQSLFSVNGFWCSDTKSLYCFQQ
jgi:hypothetical protein